MKSWFIILSGLAVSWHNIDIASSSGFYGVFLPIVFASLLLAAMIKLAMKIGPDGAGGSDHGGGSGGFGGDGGGDGC